MLDMATLPLYLVLGVALLSLYKYYYNYYRYHTADDKYTINF